MSEFKVWMVRWDKQISCQTMADQIGTRRRWRNCANQSKENVTAIRLCFKLFCLCMLFRGNVSISRNPQMHTTHSSKLIYEDFLYRTKPTGAIAMKSKSNVIKLRHFVEQVAPITLSDFNLFRIKNYIYSLHCVLCAFEDFLKMKRFPWITCTGEKV